MRAPPGSLLFALLIDVLAACHDSSKGLGDRAASQGDAASGLARDAGDAATGIMSGDASTGADASTRDASASADGSADESGTHDARALPGDGGSARSFSTDRGEFFGAPRCIPGVFLLCEDFESEAPGAPADPDVWQTMDDRIRVDAARAARGAQALHVVTHSNESTHFIRTTQIAPATKLWGRLFFWVEPPRPTAFSHWTVIEATGAHPAGGSARIRFGGIHVPNVENRLDFNYDIWGGQPAGFHEVGRELTGHDTADSTWHCLEWLFDVNAREARLFRDGSEETGLHAMQSIDGIALDFPTLDGLNIGMAIYQDIGNSSWSVWIDEVAVDRERIGCSN